MASQIFQGSMEIGLMAGLSKLEGFWKAFGPYASSIVKSLVLAAIVFLAGRKLIQWLLKVTEEAFLRGKVDNGVSGFVMSVIKVLLYFVLIMMLANILGIETASVVTLVGSAGLTVGLALQGSLSNFAGGVLLLVLKPFHVGDYIIAQECEGTVEAVDLFYTKILTIDNRSIVLPNGMLSNGSIINVTREPERRIDLTIRISYGDDVRLAKALLQTVADRHADAIIQMPEKGRTTTIMVMDFGDYALEITFRVWVKKEVYWELRPILLEEIKDIFDENHIAIPVVYPFGARNQG